MNTNQNTTGHHCEGCIFWRRLYYYGDSSRVCLYILYTGRRRGCPVQGCTKKTIGGITA